jgi:hypothetical protein
MLWRTNDGGGVGCIYCFKMTLYTRYSGTALTGEFRGTDGTGTDFTILRSPMTSNSICVSI